VVSWYDNEAGYSARLADLAALILKAEVSKKKQKLAVLEA
jgi:hypothetical protein